MNDQAELLTPGDRLREAIDRRGWSQTDLAEIIGRPIQLINEIITGRRSITPETALDLGAAFNDISPIQWLTWEAQHQVRQARRSQTDAIQRRARLYSRWPVREMTRRRWIPPTTNDDDLEAVLERFRTCGGEAFGAPIAAAARKASYDEQWTPEEEAWLCRAKWLARKMPVAPFAVTSVSTAIDRLRAIRHDADGVRRVQKILAEVGIKLLVVQPLTGMRIDGACFWDGETPVIVLALRFDRIDNFWFVLLHELAHIDAGDGKEGPLPLDRDIQANLARQDQLPKMERDANERASRELVPASALRSFIDDVRPYYSRARVERFARSVGVHPGVVVGQLHHLGEIPYANLRKLLVPVREAITASVLTDGWGQAPAVTG